MPITVQRAKKSLPPMTHLQCFIVHLVAKDSHSGRFLRQRLEEIGEKKTAAAFYQLMSRLEPEWVKGWYEVEVIDGQTIKERKYRATMEGIREFKRTVGFYESLIEGSEID